MSYFESTVPGSGYLPQPILRKSTHSFLGSVARFGASLLLLGVAYFLTARLSQGEFFGQSRFGVFWAPNAFVLAAFILTSRKHWWLVLAAAAIAHFFGMANANPTWRMVWQVAVNFGFVVATAAALRRFIGFPLRFERRREVLRYVAVAVVMPLVLAATTPAFILSLAGVETLYSPAIAFTRLALANVTPLLLVTPAVLLCAHPDAAWRNVAKRRPAEAAVILASVLLVGAVAFNVAPELASLPWLLLLTFPPLIWAAVRLGPAGTSISIVCIAALSLWGAVHELGPFVAAHGDVVLSLQIYWIVICPPVMLLAAVTREHEQVEEALNDQRNQLAHATRVAMVSELSGALAHELRQPLTAIFANAQAANLMLARPGADLADIRDMLRDIEQQSRLSASVVGNLRQFVKKGESRFELVAVEALVHDALALGKTTIDLAGVEVQIRCASDLPRVRGDAVQLMQVVLNLIVNACEAMSAIPPAGRRLQLQVVQSDALHVEIVATDWGSGLPNGYPDRVFKPFFTTKPDGLGLGLAIARSIAIAHGGSLRGESNPRGGATFRLQLPVATE